MEFVNHTPFPGIVFQGRDHDDVAQHVVVLRGTMTLDGAPRLSQRQRDLVMADAHWGEAHDSSAIEESDLAPYKPRTDVHVRGTARAPGGVAARAWDASVRVGERRSTVRVPGPRWWVREDGAWRLTESLPCAAVPLRYELAYGGTVRDGDREERCEENPVGTGFAPAWWRDGRERIAASQLEYPDDPLVAIDRPIAPAGLGPVGRAWLPRRLRAGTYDDAWQRERWPAIPRDFDMGYWCAAPRGLDAEGFLEGGEEVHIQGIGGQDELRFRLPAHDVFATLRHESGVVLSFPMRLDTVSIDVDELEVGLVWRLTTAVEPRVRLLEARMIFHDPDDEPGRHA